MVAGCTGGGVLIVMHGHSCITIDPHVPIYDARKTMVKAGHFGGLFLSMAQGHSPVRVATYV